MRSACANGVPGWPDPTIDGVFVTGLDPKAAPAGGPPSRRPARPAPGRPVRARCCCSFRIELKAGALTVHDDGTGFDPAAAATAAGLGLALMRERATEIGAQLAVTSAPGAGTTVQVRLA
jgi:hypothetical protein